MAMMWHEMLLRVDLEDEVFVSWKLKRRRLEIHTKKLIFKALKC